MTSLAAVILAGGRSSRMGRDKALLSIGAETLIQRTCRIALQCTDDVRVVTPWPDRYRSEVPDTVRFIVEVSRSKPADMSPGPLMALITALGVLQAKPEPPDWVLTLACDMPNLSAAVLTTWRDELNKLDPQYLAYLPKRQQRWEPLCGFYRVASLDALEQYSATGERSLQAWLNQQATPGRILVASRFPNASRIALIPATDEAMFTNVNTPSDLAEWQKIKRS